MQGQKNSAYPEPAGTSHPRDHLAESWVRLHSMPLPRPHKKPANPHSASASEIVTPVPRATLYAHSFRH